ncbi:MAG: hypothetical protein AAF639_05800 [Chloroflexota bacterium]
MTKNIQSSQQGQTWLPSKGTILFTLCAMLVTIGLTLGTVTYALSTGIINVGAASLNQPAANTPSTSIIPYQGRLADADGNPLTATVDMHFRLYDTAEGGTPLWAEAWTDANGVQVTDGLFNVMLGSITPISATVMSENSSLFLGLAAGGDDEMTPRVQLGSVPFAMQGWRVPNGSITTEKLADGAVTSAKLDSVGTLRLLGEKTCENCGNVTQQNLSGWQDIKGQNVNDLMEVTAQTNGGNILVTMTGRYHSSPASSRWCGISVYQGEQQIRFIHLEGTHPVGKTYWGCSGSYLFTDLPAGTYTFRARAWLGGMADVTWDYERQIAVIEF